VKIPLEGKIRVADSERHARVNGIACVDDHDMRAVDAQFEPVQQAVVELVNKRVSAGDLETRRSGGTNIGCSTQSETCASA
jgi:hypothetical protein